MSAVEVKKKTGGVASPDGARTQAAPAVVAPSAPAPVPAAAASVAPAAAPGTGVAAAAAPGAEVLRAGAGPVRTDNVMMEPVEVPERGERRGTGVGIRPVKRGGSAPRDAATGVENVAVPVDAAERAAVKPTAAPRKWTNEEMYDYLNGFTPKTAEELARERKRHKREAIISAIGDGISAISNLVYTTKYAPNAYTGKDTLSERNRARWEKARKVYDDDLKAWIHGKMAARKADRDAGQQSAILELKQQAAELKQRDLDRRQRESDFKMTLAELDRKYKEKKIEGQDYINELNRLRMEAQAAQNPLMIELMNTRIAKYKAEAAGGGGSGGRGKKYNVYDKNGKVVGKADTEVDAVILSSQLGYAYPEKTTRGISKNGNSFETYSGYGGSDENDDKEMPMYPFYKP